MEKIFSRKWIFIIGALFLLNIQALAGTLSEKEKNPTQSTTYNTPLMEGASATIWHKLQPLSSAKLMSLLQKEKDPVQAEWIELALLNKENKKDTVQLAKALLDWQKKNPTHPANELLPDTQTLTQLLSAKPPQQIAVLLPLSGSYGASGLQVRAGLIQAYYENFPHEDTQTIRFYDTSPSTNVNKLYEQAIADGADFVIGPLVKSNVEQLTSIADYQTPTLALNYTDAPLHSNFYEFGLMPEDEAHQLATHAINDNHKRAIIIAPQNTWGNHLVDSFSKHWQALGGHIQETWYYTSQTHFDRDIAHLMGIDPDDHNKTHTPHRRQDFDVIFLFAKPQEARMIVPLLRFNYANDAAIYATSSIYNGKPGLETHVDLNGVIICDIPWDKQDASTDLSAKRLFAVGRDAFLLSQSMPRLKLLPRFAMYAATGALILTSKNQIRRHVPCTAVRSNELN